MSESSDEMRTRVELMVEDNGDTWDLSDNDREALRALLSDLDEARKVSALLGQQLDAAQRVLARAHGALTFYATGETDGGTQARAWLAEGEPRGEAVPS